MTELRESRTQARSGSHEDEWDRSPKDVGAVELGTVGWDDADDAVDPGTPANETSGVTLVRVTLFSGKDPNVAHDPTRGQGTKILARNSGGEVVPAAGSQVVVVRPAGIDGPGAWHVVCNPGAPVGPVQFADGGTFMRRERDGTFSIGTTTDGTKDGGLVYLQLSRTGLVFKAPWGKLTFDQGGFHAMHHSGAGIDLGGVGGLPAPLDQMSSYAEIRASIMRLQGSAISCGPDTGVFEQLAKALSTIIAIDAIVTWSHTVDLALIAIGSALTGPSAPAAVTAIGVQTTAQGVMAAAVTTSHATIPSQSTGAT